jgi:hypothetical protein
VIRDAKRPGFVPFVVFVAKLPGVIRDAKRLVFVVFVAQVPGVMPDP